MYTILTVKDEDGSVSCLLTGFESREEVVALSRVAPYVLYGIAAGNEDSFYTTEDFDEDLDEDVILDNWGTASYHLVIDRVSETAEIGGLYKTE